VQELAPEAKDTHSRLFKGLCKDMKSTNKALRTIPHVCTLAVEKSVNCVLENDKVCYSQN